MRLDLGAGQWADLHDRLDYGTARGVRLALLRSLADDDAKVGLDIALVRAYVEGWHVLGIGGEAVPVTELETAPDDIIQVIAAEALEVWNGNHDPKAANGSGPASSATTEPASEPG